MGEVLKDDKSQKGKKSKPARALLEPVSEDGSSSFARALGSVDYQTREKGLQALTIYLSKSTQLSTLAMRKLWKGIFYCFWHSDKAPVQEALASRLAAIMPQLTNEVALLYFSAFLETMQREWFGIDRLRMDKFLMMVRRFIRQLFVHLDSCNWDAEVVSTYTCLLQDLLTQSNDQTAAGLSFQVADVFVPELLAVLEEGGRGAGGGTLKQLLDVFVEALATCGRGSLLPRIREGVFQAVLQELEQPSPSQPLGALDVAAFSDFVFQKGARPEVHAKAREILYELSAALEKAGGKKRKRAESVALGGADSSTAEGLDPATWAGIAAAEVAAPGTKSAKKAKKNGKKSTANATADPAQLDSLLPALKLGKLKTATLTASGGMATRGSPTTSGSPSQSMPAGLSAAVAAVAGVVGSPRATPSPTAAGGGARSGAVAAKSRLSGLGSGTGTSLDGTPGSLKKKGKKRASLATEAITRAAERALAAVGQQKKGQATVHPPTPGSPSQANFDELFQESLQEELRQGASPRGISPQEVAGGAASESNSGNEPSLADWLHNQPPANKKRKEKNGNLSTPGARSTSRGTPASSTPGSSAKHVRFKLKNNLYFQEGGEVPSPELRTPESCKPKGSALKKESKFARKSARGSLSPRGPGSPRGSASPRGAKAGRGLPGNRNKRKSNLGTPGSQKKV